MKIFHKPAFTLVEIIVAFSVIVLVILASTNLLVTVIRSNSENADTLVAYGLAQEGLEAVRNVRDSNWLLGADFQGKVGANCLWPNGGCFPGTVGTKKVFAVNFQQIQSMGGGSASSTSDIPNYAPWELKDVTPSNPAEDPVNDPSVQPYIRLYLSSAPGSDDVWYRHCFIACSLETSLFSRYIEVEPLPYTTDPSKVKKYRVSSVVRWQELSRPKEVRLTTELADWKGGPL